MKEFLGELPPEVERAFAEAREPDAKGAPRIFTPTRPTLLRKGDSVRITVVSPGPWKVARVTLFARAQGTWIPTTMKLVQRRTYTAELPWRESTGPLLDYCAAAEIEADGARKVITTPPEAPQRFHTATLA